MAQRSRLAKLCSVRMPPAHAEVSAGLRQPASGVQCWHRSLHAPCVRVTPRQVSVGHFFHVSSFYVARPKSPDRVGHIRNEGRADESLQILPACGVSFSSIPAAGCAAQLCPRGPAVCAEQPRCELVTGVSQTIGTYKRYLQGLSGGLHSLR